MSRSSVQRRRTTLLLLAAASAIAIVIVYLLAVHTGWGQRLDGAALRGRVFQRPRVREATDDLLATISVSSLVLLGLAITVGALFRGRPRLALGVVVVIAGANLTTQVMKHALSRPHLVADEPLDVLATYPSGHTTVAMSLAIALVLAVPARSRGVAALVGGAYALAIGVAVLASGWHRPSDAVGAYLVAGAWGAAVAALLARPPRPGGAAPGSARVASPLLAIAGASLVVVAFLALVAAAAGRELDRFDTVDLSAAFFAGAASIAGCGLLVLAALLGALRSVELDPPPWRTLTTPTSRPVRAGR